MGKIITDHSRLAHILEGLKAQGKRIVFCNGCFDVLHVGHIRYLSGAKALGDVVVVAINSDDSVRKIKGPPHPVMPEAERMEIVAALRDVDYVTCFSEPSADSLLLKLSPHVHAKGTDYTLETIPERKTVLSYGGELAIVGDPKNHSSTSIKKQVFER
ncbi:MAG TPA: adenylyltransferase/cytidyltransferase family protein [Candidatus Tripitaka californicus]|uniref:adenylyltransferase/cytidyltransferase family protein n=1 Tax=Candidatus Tripitaka californicus TaxID=3367616 RepID=UPI0040299F68|nr:adenylyltransferase/cytidyltransferase family protein [Planctomycetota bacterium]